MALIAVDKVKMGWAIGLFEGEGSIITYERAYKEGRTKRKGVTLIVQTTDKDVLKEFHRIVKVGTFTGPYTHNKKKQSNYKLVWAWRCSKASDVLTLLIEWYPLLGRRRRSKARQAIKAAKISLDYKAKVNRECKHGHKRTKENTSFDKTTGGRRCLICHAASQNKRNKLKKKGR